jgi:hypothetical protein
MRAALRGDRERAEARRKTGRPGVPPVPTVTRNDPPAAQVEAPAAPPGPTDTPAVNRRQQGVGGRAWRRSPFTNGRSSTTGATGVEHATSGETVRGDRFVRTTEAWRFVSRSFDPLFIRQDP